LSKGGEVGEVGELTEANRTLDRTLDLCVRLVLARWSYPRSIDRTLALVVT
jgi:hypothetical protein